MPLRGTTGYENGQTAVHFHNRHPAVADTWSVGDPGAPPRGTADPEILRWCEEHQFLLVTNNRHSMPQHLGEHLAAGGHVPGILLLRRRATPGPVIDDLLLIAEVAPEDEYRDRIEYVPL